MVLMTLPAFGNDSVDELIEIQGVKEGYEFDNPKEKFLKNINETFAVIPGQEGTHMESVALETVRKLTELADIYMSWPAVRNQTKQVFLATYTQEELDYMLEIFSTDIGKSISKKSNLFHENMKLNLQEFNKEFRNEYEKVTDIYSDASSAYIEELKSNLSTE